MELDFFGKEFIRNHHLTVPYRPLLPDAEKSVGEPDLGGNLIIHGDNLHALKALLPVYAGKVDCIFIDPPYNTGNEGWSYNDNVSSPLLREWFKSNPISVDDLMRHDKWCCMMWPRLRLLKELLKEGGLMFISIDDIEVHRLKLILDEVFDTGAVLGEFVWRSRRNPDNRNKSGLSNDHEYIICVGKSMPGRRREKDNSVDGEEQIDSGNMVGMATIDQRPNLHYCFKNPATGVWYDCPPKGWRYSWQTMLKLINSGRILWPRRSGGRPREMVLRSELTDFTNISSVISGGPFTDDGTRELTQIFAGSAFDFPKPVAIPALMIAQISDPNALILDSFAGSGTTAHAVLQQNDMGGGNRRFILVETEDYADSLTAERVRRVIHGYSFQGTQRETLFEKKLTWTEVKKGDALREEAEAVKEARKDDFDSIKIEVKDGTLRVVGERSVAEKAPGLGGTFTYCTLGDPVDQDEILKRKQLPDREALADWLLFTAFGTAKLDGKTPPGLGDLAERYVGNNGHTHVWLLYRPEREYLLSPAAALTLDLARLIDAVDRPSKHLVFSPSKYVSQKMLKRETQNRVDHAPLPFSLFQLERE